MVCVYACVCMCGSILRCGQTEQTAVHVLRARSLQSWCVPCSQAFSASSLLPSVSNQKRKQSLETGRAVGPVPHWQNDSLKQEIRLGPVLRQQLVEPVWE